jgi:alanyl-tRNA synthetase
MVNDSQIRQHFVDFFKSHNHKHIKSSPLTPDDKTLLFTNSGMVQFKDIFAGTKQTTEKRAVTVQKCVRAGGKHNDLDNVGYTNRHHTFFEMLGNFSFGDYFKQEAISFAWHFLTKELGIDKNRLYVTVYHTDDEAHNLWEKHIDKSRIIKINTNDNFWQVGSTGPCGPCSEIFYDYGDSVSGGLPGTENQDGARYTEIWNLVFMQNFIHENGTITDLPKKNIDTGMGFERLLSVLENTVDNYSTTPFKKLITEISDITKILPSKNIFTANNFNQNDITLRILADHIRTISFLIADGVLPSNEGRGYVLRRIIRRALKSAYFSGVQTSFLPQIAEILRHQMADTYPELNTAMELIHAQTHAEEEKFMELLPKGIKILEKEVHNNVNNGVLSGDLAFKLYDTYGFPLDITTEIAKKYGVKSVDEKGFENLMHKQQERGQASWKGSNKDAIDELRKEISHLPETEFLGYNSMQCRAKVLYSKNGYAVFDKTAFYAESGGQIADTGTAGIATVTDCQKIDGKFVHYVSENLPFSEVDLIVDEKRREKISANHTATHLLHYVLRQKYGEALIQKGSLVKDDGFRFDFSHSKPITLEEIHEIEIDVNKIICQNIPIGVANCTQENAKTMGAMALFGEKYGETVRVISAGSSIELCGGIHVKHTGEIGLFKIVSQASVASGVRRIEAKTQIEALIHAQLFEKELQETKSQFKINNNISDFITQLQNEYKLSSQQNKAMQLKFASLAPQHKLEMPNIDCSYKVVENYTGNLKEIAEQINAENKLVFNKNATDFTLCIAGNHGKTIAEFLQTNGMQIKFGGSANFVTGGGIGHLKLPHEKN